jgi:hypothetical protein
MDLTGHITSEVMHGNVLYFFYLNKSKITHGFDWSHFVTSAKKKDFCLSNVETSKPNALQVVDQSGHIL